MTTFEIYGGDHGCYTIHRRGMGKPVALIERNQKGGGYTVTRTDDCARYYMGRMPIAENLADCIMESLT